MPAPGRDPRIGPLTRQHIAAIGNGAAFKKGRGFAAWLGVVPGEHSTGGKQKLLVPAGVATNTCESFRARSAFRAAAENEAIFGPEYVAGQSHIAHAPNVATVALANKMARMAWAVLFKGEAYRPPLLPDRRSLTGLQLT